jgi:hypothetical protein
MKVEIAIAKGSSNERGGHRPCWIRINTQTFCVVNWSGEPYVKLSSVDDTAPFDNKDFDVIDLLGILKVKESKK